MMVCLFHLFVCLSLLYNRVHESNDATGHVECKIMSRNFVSAVSHHLSLTQATTDFEDLIASLKISKGSQQTPPPSAPPQAPTSQSDSPLSPQSFAMVSIFAVESKEVRQRAGQSFLHAWRRIVMFFIGHKNIGGN